MSTFESQSDITQPIGGTPVAKAFNTSPDVTMYTDSDKANLQALDKDITDYNKTITALKTGMSKSTFDQIKSHNDNKDPKWYASYETDNNTAVINKIQSNLNNQLKNIKSEYNDAANTHNTYRDTHKSQDRYNTYVVDDINNNLSQLDKTAQEIATKTRIAEINHEYSELKAKKINALKVGLVLAFLTVFPLVLAMSGHISWLTFFGTLVTITVIYGIYLIYVFTRSATDPYTSPYTSDYQAFQDWLATSISAAGNELTDCKPCPGPKPKPDPKPETKSTDRWVGDNQGYIYYDGSSPQQVITGSNISTTE